MPRWTLTLGAALSVATLFGTPSAHAADDMASTDELRPADAPGKPNAQMQAVLDELAGLKPKPIEGLEPKDARKQPTPADAVKALLKKQKKSTDPEAVADVDNKKIKGPGGHDVAIRVYTPKGNGTFPVVVYYHGGGWVIADLDVYDATPRALTNAATAVVVSVEYAHAPEHKYPAALDDAFAAYQWVVAHAGEIKGDPKRIAVAGESAGGNLATEVCLRAAETHAPMPVHQLLVYPVTNYGFDTPSYQQYAQAKPLNKGMMAWFFKHYLPDESKGSDPHVSPLRASGESLKEMPPATILTAEVDPLRDDGRMYAEKLKKAGVDVTYKNYEGVTHEFFGMAPVVDVAKQAQADAAKALRGAFGG